MTIEEKQLLLKDLCARLPYGFKYQVQYGDTSVRDVKKFILDGEYSLFDVWMVDEIKPYLRPMSSMTEEEIEEYVRLQYKDCIDVERPAHCCKNSITAVVVTLTSRESLRYWYNDMVSKNTIDFLNSHHFDWRGLIPMDLAFEAPEEMYETKTK